LVTTVCTVAVPIAWIRIVGAAARPQRVGDHGLAGTGGDLDRDVLAAAGVAGAIVTSAQVTVPPLVLSAGPVQLPRSVDTRTN
jgi:hypothetical protein